MPPGRREAVCSGPLRHFILPTVKCSPPLARSLRRLLAVVFLAVVFRDQKTTTPFRCLTTLTMVLHPAMSYDELWPPRRQRRIAASEPRTCSPVAPNSALTLLRSVAHAFHTHTPPTATLPSSSAIVYAHTLPLHLRSHPSMPPVPRC